MSATRNQSPITTADDPRFMKAYETVRRSAYRFVSRRCRWHVVEELLQEAAARVIAFLGKGKLVENLAAFLYRTFTNLVFNHWRKRPMFSLPNDIENLARYVDHCEQEWVEMIEQNKCLLGKIGVTNEELLVIERNADSRRQFEADLAKAIVNALLGKGPKRPAQVVKMRLLGMNSDEVANLLGVTRKTVNVNVSRFRCTIRRLVLEYLDEASDANDTAA